MSSVHCRRLASLVYVYIPPKNPLGFSLGEGVRKFQW